MRIGLVTGEYPPMEGGVGDFTHRLSDALCAQDHDVHILAPESDLSPEDRSGPIVHRRIQANGWPLIRTIDRWVSEVSPDVINIQYQAAAFGMHGAINFYPWVRRRRAAPVVVTYHDLLPPYLFPKAGPIRQWSVWKLARHADGVITTNNEDQRELDAALGESVPPVRIIPIGSNIDPTPPDGFTPEAWRKSYGIDPEDLLLGFFGFMNRSKGIETLISALASLADRELPISLVFVGGRTGTSDQTNASYADEIDALIAESELSGRVYTTGFTEPQGVSAGLLSLDICVLPFVEGASLRHGTLHAALKHGNAIITTQPRQPIPQLRHRKNCYLIPPDDVKALESAILTLARRPEERKALGKRAERLAQSFSWDRIAERTAEFFASLTA